MPDSVKSKADVQRQKRKRFIETFEPYARECLLPRMGIAADNLAINIPEFGERSMVLFLSAGGREMVVRSFPRRAGRVRTMRAVRFSLGHGVKVPRILHVEQSRATRRALGYSLLIEERIRGIHPTDAPNRNRMISITAAGISRMHNVTRSRWGNLRIGRRWGYFARQMEAAEKHVHRSEKPDSALPSHWPEIRRWLERFEPMTKRIRRYSFCHRAIASDNLMITPDGELCLLDVQRLCFDHFAANLVRSLLLFGDNEDAQHRYLDQYFKTATDRSPEEFARWREFFRVLHLIRLVNYARDKNSRLEDGTSQAVSHEQEIFELVRQRPARN